jgi:hypothetical protein
MKRSKQAKRAVFLAAAEIQALRFKNGSKRPEDTEHRSNAWSCLNIKEVCGIYGRDYGFNEEDCDKAEEFYREYFEPKVIPYGCGGGWWPVEDHNEERILALLLCAEMLRR